ncbi:porin family protein [Fodinibius sp. Rm-B-1B1-1]|uniref:porin family protein n=1 Tax=Fodinibius alkaliphilus TaxID=3140241 RepID=UPI0031599C6B
MRINKQKILALTIPVILVLSTLMGSEANAQSAPLSWGFKAGINASTIYGDNVNDVEAQAGFNGGIYLNYRFNNWSLQPEVFYSMKGAELDQGFSGQTDYEFGYLSVPVLVKYHFVTKSSLEPTLYAGPQMGFSLYGDADDQEIDDSLADTEFSLAFGGGLDLLTAKHPSDFIQKVGLDLRYTLGLTNLFDVTGDPEAKNSAFSAAVILGF